ncbi:MAG: hypothetical protein HFH85_04715 [Lachnospiraceae bacterium]|jgi:hypothetical protein|nr:hypothetical protein [Lachnospiraceae bacterium]
MDNVSTEQKLRLVQQVRSRYHENQYDLSNRERILYGKSNMEQEAFGQTYSYGTPYGEGDGADAEPLSFFKLRMWIALFLLTAVIVMDRNGTEVAGISSEKIFQMISADYEEVIETWVETISQ